MKKILCLLLAGFSFVTPARANQTLTYNQIVYIARPADVVWSALTQKPMVDRYYLAPLQDAPLQEGTQIYYGTLENKMIYGEVLKLEAPTRFSHSFIFSDRPSKKSIVTYDIEPMGTMSMLQVRHEFTDDNAGYADVAGGWPVILSGLKTLLETGKELPWPAPESETKEK
ncbi:MAG: SRPBCC domain-containing protein [Alphaproteobacteria bacterium]